MQERQIVLFHKRIVSLTYTLIHCFDCLYRSFHNTGMTYHVRICEVYNDNIILLGKINTSAAYSEEMISVYAMTGLTPGEQQLDDDEALNVIEMPFKEAYDMAASGKLIDAKTIAALLMAKEQLGL